MVISLVPAGAQTECGEDIIWSGPPRILFINPTRDPFGLRFATGITVPAGTYDVTISTADEYVGRENSLVSAQSHEQVYVSVGAAASGATPDLQDLVPSASVTADVGTITTTGGELILHHIGDDPNPLGLGPVHSLNAVAVLLSPRCGPPTTPPVTTTPTTTPPPTTAPPTTPPGTDPTTTTAPPSTTTPPPTTPPPTSPPGTDPTTTTAPPGTPPTTTPTSGSTLPELGGNTSPSSVAAVLVLAGLAMLAARRRVRPD
jgi:MYXO-CTERM domain-containing protein